MRYKKREARHQPGFFVSTEYQSRDQSFFASPITTIIADKMRNGDNTSGRTNAIIACLHLFGLEECRAMAAVAANVESWHAAMCFHLAIGNRTGQIPGERNAGIFATESRYKKARPRQCCLAPRRTPGTARAQGGCASRKINSVRAFFQKLMTPMNDERRLIPAVRGQTW